MEEENNPKPPLIPDILSKDVPEGFLADEQVYDALDLGKLSLAGIKARQVKLKESKFVGFDLNLAELKKIEISNARFTNCNFANTKMREGNVERVEFVSCQMMGVDFSEAILSHIRFVDCRINNHPRGGSRIPRL
ncbi:MAG: pentapeptide repeat-containing protein [bacterium]|nr:pentapeptide repeat-containing protein [bacterium]